MNQLSQLLSELPEWPKAILIFVCVYAIFSFLRRWIWSRLKKFTQKTEARWDDYLMEDLYAPVRFLFVLGSIGVASTALTLKVHHEQSLVYGLKIGTVIGILWIVARIARVYIQTQTKTGKLSESNGILLLTLGRILMISIATLTVLDTFGISVTPILASLGVGSVAVALALQDTLSNFFSGIYLLIDKPIRPGDFVTIDENTSGHVVKIGWRSTHVQLLPNNMVIVPNSKIAGSTILNYDYPVKEMSVLVDAGVSYHSDLKKVERVTIAVAKEVLSRIEGGVKTFDPFIRFHTFNSSSIDFTVILRVDQFTSQYLVKHEFIKALHERYAQENIEIPFPQRVVHLQHENPASERPVS